MKAYTDYPLIELEDIQSFEEAAKRRGFYCDLVEDTNGSPIYASSHLQVAWEIHVAYLHNINRDKEGVKYETK